MVNASRKEIIRLIEVKKGFVWSEDGSATSQEEGEYMKDQDAAENISIEVDRQFTFSIKKSRRSKS